MTQPNQLWIVRPGCREPLLWPQSVGGGVRGHAGTVVDGRDPLLTLEDGISQQWKLRPAPEGADVTPHANRQAHAVHKQAGLDLPFDDPDQGPDLSLPEDLAAPGPAAVDALEGEDVDEEG